jgi:hypothetical protein
MSYTPEVWVGRRNGVVVAEYPDRWTAETALRSRKVETISPKNWGKS